MPRMPKVRSPYDSFDSSDRTETSITTPSEVRRRRGLWGHARTSCPHRPPSLHADLHPPRPAPCLRPQTRGSRSLFAILALVLPGDSIEGALVDHNIG